MSNVPETTRRTNPTSTGTGIEIVVSQSRHRAQMRTYLLAVAQSTGAIMRRQMLGSSLTTDQIAARAIEFADAMRAWYRPLPSVSLVSRCDQILL